MVVSTIDDVKKSAMDSQPLKFGMDRILSEEISSKSEAAKEVNCTSTPPCAGCLTSLYRCCRNPPLSGGLPSFYKTLIHAPQPLRPYTNVKSDSGIQVPVQQPSVSGGNPRRKRSWSRAVFSNLQRKGLEKRFQLQKYITKPDRRQLAATLGLSDAQVKVWFQNRRMKWRHTKEAPRQNFMNNEAGENVVVTADSTQNHQSDSDCESDIDVQTVDEQMKSKQIQTSLQSSPSISPGAALNPQLKDHLVHGEEDETKQQQICNCSSDCGDCEISSSF